MSMTRPEEGILFAWALADLVGQDVAICIEPSGVTAAAINTATAPHQGQSALVNLMRNGNPKRSAMVCLSYELTEMDQGMFQMSSCSGGLVWASAAQLHKGSVNNFAWTATAIATPILGKWLSADRAKRIFEAKLWCARNRLDKRPVTPPQASTELSEVRGRLVRAYNPPVLKLPNLIAVPGYRVTPLSDAILMTLAYSIARLSWSEGSITTSDASGATRQTPFSENGGHNIACVIVDNTGKIIGWGRNHNAVGASLHGEVMAVLNYQRLNGTAIPHGSRIYSTLKPCYMCAGLLVTAAPGCTVISGQDDTNIVGSALDRAVSGCSTEVRTHETTGIELLRIQGSRSTTSSLATDRARGLMEDALYEFFTIGANIRGWELDLWMEGLELLKSISPHVETLRGYMLKGMV